MGRRINHINDLIIINFITQPGQARLDSWIVVGRIIESSCATVEQDDECMNGIVHSSMMYVLFKTGCCIMLCIIYRNVCIHRLDLLFLAEHTEH